MSQPALAIESTDFVGPGQNARYMLEVSRGRHRKVCQNRVSHLFRSRYGSYHGGASARAMSMVTVGGAH